MLNGIVYYVGETVKPRGETLDGGLRLWSRTVDNDKAEQTDQTAADTRAARP
jgi:hypothetical protein